MESIVEILKVTLQWIRENHVDIVGIIMVTILALGLFPPIFKKKKPKILSPSERNETLLRQWYENQGHKWREEFRDEIQRMYKISTATDDFEKDEMTLMVGPSGIIEYNPPNEKSEFTTIFEPWPEDKKKKPKRKLDL
jgi:hypothetical protein